MDPATLDLVSCRLKALADPTRLRILHALEPGELCVGSLASRVGCGQANVSKHLAMLRGAGLVRARRCGMNVYYAIDDPVVFRICRLVCASLAAPARARARRSTPAARPDRARRALPGGVRP
jgi:DNA-binding transcriptional ArsR family regulator